MRIVLVNPYELGRQPFGLAEPAAMLAEAGCRVDCLDLSIQHLEADVLAPADLVAVYVGMHTATRIAVEALPRIRELAPRAHLCVYGLYAPMNEAMLRGLGVGTVLGGEYETGLLSLVERLRAGDGASQSEPVVDIAKVAFRVPDRSRLPGLEKYAHLIMPDGTRRVVGFAEATRGCKHLCRHCPIVPVYQGRFRAVPREVVLADVANQVAAGAEHISFGDPDFLNGPTHAVKLAEALHREFPQITFDATVKIEHLLKHRDVLPVLRDNGCLFITSAVESIDERILEYFDKNHTDADFGEAVALMREVGIHLAPTFVPFTPWTTIEGYIALLDRLAELRLVESIPPIQLAIRLLIPEGSYLLHLPEVRELVEPFDPVSLGYPWVHEDPRVDALQKRVQAFAAEADERGLARRETFEHVWALAHAALGRTPPALDAACMGEPIPHMSEPWYCCAEPTDQQLAAI